MASSFTFLRGGYTQFGNPLSGTHQDRVEAAGSLMDRDDDEVLDIRMRRAKAAKTNEVECNKN